MWICWPSPLYLGIIWMWACGTTWPATSLLFIITLKPSAPNAESVARATFFVKMVMSVSKSSGMSVSVSWCAFGMIRVWPTFAGAMSMKASSLSSSWTLVAGIVPSAILQKIHSFSILKVKWTCRDLNSDSTHAMGVFYRIESQARTPKN